MKRESLPSAKELLRATEAVAIDLYGFGLVCHGGVAWMAEPEILDTIFLGLENFWFTDDFSHKEFREEFFKALWERCKGKNIPAKVGEDVPLGHDRMEFYKLPQLERAMIYLRTKKKFSYASIALILGMDERVVRKDVERVREHLLGHRLRAPVSAEEEF